MPDTEQLTIDMGASMETEQALDIIDALNDISDVSAMAGRNVSFTGTKVTALAGVGDLAGIDVYSCPRGWLVLFRTHEGPHWCTSGTDVSEAVAAIEDEGLRGVVDQQLRAHGLL